MLIDAEIAVLLKCKLSICVFCQDERSWLWPTQCVNDNEVALAESWFH